MINNKNLRIKMYITRKIQNFVLFLYVKKKRDIE